MHKIKISNLFIYLCVEELTTFSVKGNYHILSERHAQDIDI